MFATTTKIVFCGFQWLIAINEGLYNCRTSFDDVACKVVVECDTGYAKRQMHSSVVESITETLELNCKDETESRSTRLRIFNEFAASVSCIK